MVIYNFEQDSEEWHKIRAGRITGTRFKTLMSGLGTAGYQDLITNLAGEIITGQREESYSNKDMQRGIDLEPEAVDCYESSVHKKTYEVGFITPDSDNQFYEWIGISPDRLIQDKNGILEVKCPRLKTHLRYIKKNKEVTEYRHQVQAQLFVTGLLYVDFMSYYPNMKPFITTIYPDKNLHKQYEERLSRIIYEVKSEIEIYKKYNYM